MSVALRHFILPRGTLRRTLGTHDVDAIRAWRLHEGPALTIADGVPLLQARVAFRRISEVVADEARTYCNIQIRPL